MHDAPRYDESRTLLTYRETAGRLALSESSVRRLVGRGVLPVVRIGRAVRFRESDVALLIEKGWEA